MLLCEVITGQHLPQLSIPGETFGILRAGGFMWNTTLGEMLEGIEGVEQEMYHRSVENARYVMLAYNSGKVFGPGANSEGFEGKSQRERTQALKAWIGSYKITEALIETIKDIHIPDLSELSEAALQMHLPLFLEENHRRVTQERIQQINPSSIVCVFEHNGKAFSLIGKPPVTIS